MRIADAYSKLSIDKPTVSGAQAAKGAERVKAGDASKSSSHGDAVKVTVSAQARELANQAAQGFDAAKVDRLRSAISNGSYKVDSSAIAARLVDGG